MIVANEYEKANINSNIEKKISKLRKHSYIPLGSKNFNFMHSVNDFYPEDTLKSKSEIEEMTTDCNYSGKESLLTKNDSYCDSVDIGKYFFLIQYNEKKTVITIRVLLIVLTHLSIQEAKQNLGNRYYLLQLKIKKMKALKKLII